MQQPKKIAIIGAGVAGLAFALLACRQGHKVQVFERKGLGTQMGAGVTLWPNATFVLAKMGLLPAIEARSGKPGWMRRLTPDNNEMTALPIAELDQLSGYPSLTILRQDLMAVLIEACKQANIALTVNHPIDQSQLAMLRQHYDLVIGADGRMQSAARHFVAPYARPVYQGFINIIGISRYAQNTLGPSAILDYCGDGQRFGIVPVSDTCAYWAAAWQTPLGDIDDPAFALPRLKARFAHWPATVQFMLEYAKPQSIRPIFVHDLDPLPCWYRQNVLLIGDAAHASLPTSGQGACQALEDAWHLAECLAQLPDTQSLLQQFQLRRQDKTSRIQLSGRALASMIFNPVSATTQAGFVKQSLQDIVSVWMSGLSMVK
ncbi:FAD-dependent monooxygenase [Bowmanella sp. Y26]|uniref:FAD-dependent monooxygenase n=1 Tax=Bowmanella yangjiangensis TaxID=2811230 RepID=UPI001BDBC359|nr:FAD-dependent monooxygenase [Bowmanella yangjiangensis]MBT1064485.1 FAD-dependent monooxygenase [Bowmanella yangjiangensis]